MPAHPPVSRQAWRRRGFWPRTSVALGAAVIVGLAASSAFAAVLFAIVAVSLVVSLS